jgi:hypothetical protein
MAGSTEDGTFQLVNEARFEAAKNTVLEGINEL